MIVAEVKVLPLIIEWKKQIAIARGTDIGTDDELPDVWELLRGSCAKRATQSNQPCGLVIAIAIALRPTQRPVQAHLSDDIGVSPCIRPSDATYGLMGCLVG